MRLQDEKAMRLQTSHAEFQSFVADLARELPDVTGIPCHLRRVRVALRMRGNVSAYAQPALSRISFSRSTRKFVEDLLASGLKAHENVQSVRAVEEAEVLAHELLHLRFDARQAERNIDAEELFPGLDSFEEALTTLLSRQAVPHILSRLGFAATDTPSSLTTPRERANDYEYVIVPLLAHLLGKSAQVQGITENHLLHCLGSAGSTIEAAHLLTQPFLSGSREMRAHALKELLGVFACASLELEAFLGNVEAGREQVDSVEDVEARCGEFIQRYASLADALLGKTGMDASGSRANPHRSPGAETIH